MKIAVCVKQVPADRVSMDQATGNIERDKSRGIMNIYDYSAVETALRIREMCGDASVSVFTMGPESACEVLRESKALGADDLYLITDKSYAGSDSLATSYVISEAIQKTGSYELIICGKQTTDGDTAQVSGSIAAWLKRPYFPWVKKIIRADVKEIELCSLMDKKLITYHSGYPCVMSVEPDIYKVRASTLKNRLNSRRACINVIDNKALLLDSCGAGREGSATNVKKIVFKHVKSLSDIKELTPEDFLKMIEREITNQ